MGQRSIQLDGIRRYVLSLGIMAMALVGCNQRPVPPEVTYEPAQVEVLNQEIEAMEQD